MKKLQIDSSITEPLLEWVLNDKNRNKHFHSPPEHKGLVVGVRNLNEVNPKLKKDDFPYGAVKSIDELILSFYDLDPNTPVDSHDGFFLSYSESGHEVHRHKDKNPDEDNLHIRFNLLISKPIKGGNPIINGVEYKIKENEVWVCESGNYYHSTTKVGGKKPRIILSLGHYINKETWK